jgi:hypothetical protein
MSGKVIIKQCEIGSADYENRKLPKGIMLQDLARHSRFSCCPHDGKRLASVCAIGLPKRVKEGKLRATLF